MVVDAEIDLSLPGLALGGDHDDSPSLAAAPVAPGALGRVQRVEQTLRERPLGVLESPRHRLPDAFALDHVRLGAEALTGRIPGRGDAGLADVNGHAPSGVEHRDLPVLRLFVRGHQLSKRLVRALAFAKKIEAERPV